MGCWDGLRWSSTWPLSSTSAASRPGGPAPRHPPGSERRSALSGSLGRGGPHRFWRDLGPLVRLRDPYEGQDIVVVTVLPLFGEVPAEQAEGALAARAATRPMCGRRGPLRVGSRGSPGCPEVVVSSAVVEHFCRFQTRGACPPTPPGVRETLRSLGLSRPGGDHFASLVNVPPWTPPGPPRRAVLDARL